MSTRNTHTQIGANGFRSLDEPRAALVQQACSTRELYCHHAVLAQVLAQLDGALEDMPPKLFELVGRNVAELGESINSELGVMGMALDSANGYIKLVTA